MFTEDKIIKIFCMADDFCKFFDAMMAKYTVKDARKRHSRHRSFDNFIVNMLGALAAYCFFPKKPCIRCDRMLDRQLILF